MVFGARRHRKNLKTKEMSFKKSVIMDNFNK